MLGGIRVGMCSDVVMVVMHICNRAPNERKGVENVMHVHNATLHVTHDTHSHTPLE